MRTRVRFIGSVMLLVAVAAAAVFRLFQLAPGMVEGARTALGWLIVTALAIAGVGLLVALVLDPSRDKSIYRDLDPTMAAEIRHRREELERNRHRH